MTPLTALKAAVWLFALTLPITIAGMNIAAALMTAALAWQALSGGRVDWRAALSPSCKAIWIYFAVGAAAAAMAVDQSNAMGDLQRDFHRVWMLTLLSLALPLAPTPKAHRAMAAAFAVAAVVGLWQAATQRWGMFHEARMRAHAFVHAVTFGEQMALAALGSLCFFGRREAGEDSSRSRALALAFLALSIAALLFSQTRGALMGLFVGVFLLGLAYRPYRRYAAGLLAAAILATAAMEAGPNRSRSFYHSLRVEGINTGDNDLNPNLHRLILWRVALQMFRDHPWLGLGLGNYKTAFVNYFQGKVDGQWVWHSAHNLFLHHMAERGGAGLAALVLLLGALTWRAYERVRQDPSPWNLWAWSSMGAFLAMNLTEVALQVEMIATLVFFIWAWAEANHGPAGRSLLSAGRKT